MNGRKQTPTACKECIHEAEIITSVTIQPGKTIGTLQGKCALYDRNTLTFKTSVPATEGQKREERHTDSLLTRYEDNPLISPRNDSWWESRQTFNPGAVLLDDEIHMVYRAIGEDGISRLGYADTGEGFEVEERLDYPVYQHQGEPSGFATYSYASGGSSGGCEDPRLVRVGNEDRLYMTYTACDNGLRVGLTSIKVKDFLDKNWNWTSPRLISPPGQIHKNWVIFPEKINGKYAVITSITPRMSITYLDSLDIPSNTYLSSYHLSGVSTGREDFWDSVIRGIGPPPIKTRLGWLLFYHAMDRYESGKYKVGAMLTDLKDPRKVIRCAASPVLEPKVVYEESGFKPGVVYLTSAVLRGEELILDYGASDSYVCVVSCELEEFLSALIEGGRTVFIKTEVPSTSHHRRKKRSLIRHRRSISSAGIPVSMN
ncbi:MAG: hypothetical protein JW712_13470 [Dehalococcoidales bacterium]|nr:hypothetical protein [Dehalococcoidales bacterium]